MRPSYRARRPHGELPCTFHQACHVLWAVRIMRWSQARAAHVLNVHAGTVSHIVRRNRFPDAYPIAIPGYA